MSVAAAIRVIAVGEAMKPGDIVNFYTGAWVFNSANERYQEKNPGVIIEVFSRPSGAIMHTILWADGSSSTEHKSYLQKEEEVCTLETK